MIFRYFPQIHYKPIFEIEIHEKNSLSRKKFISEERHNIILIDRNRNNEFVVEIR